jgi:protein TonB
METLDYRKMGLWEGGFLKGMAVSIPFHMAALLLMLAVSFSMPHQEKDLPLCTEALLDMQASGGDGGKALKKEDGPPPCRVKAALTPPAPKASTENKRTVSRHWVKKEKRTPVPVSITPKRSPEPVPRPVEQEAVQDMPQPEPEQHAAWDSATAASPDESSGQEAGSGSQAFSGEAGVGGGARGGNGSGGETVGFGGNGDNPAFIKKVLPKYPWRARKLGREGRVLILITLGETGTLVSAEVIEKAGPELDEAALTAVRRSTFRPARRSGVAMRCRAYLPIVFRLKK